MPDLSSLSQFDVIVLAACAALITLFWNLMGRWLLKHDAEYTALSDEEKKQREADDAW